MRNCVAEIAVTDSGWTAPRGPVICTSAGVKVAAQIGSENVTSRWSTAPGWTPCGLWLTIRGPVRSTVIVPTNTSSGVSPPVASRSWSSG